MIQNPTTGSLEIEKNQPFLAILNLSKYFDSSSALKQTLENLCQLKIQKIKHTSILSKLTSFKDFSNQSIKIYNVSLLSGNESFENVKDRIGNKNFLLDQIESKNLVELKSNEAIQDFLVELWKVQQQQQQQSEILKPGVLFIEKANNDCSWPLEIINLKKLEVSRLEADSNQASNNTLSITNLSQRTSSLTINVPGREGIINIGNSCFISSALQILLHLNTFKSFYSTKSKFLKSNSANIVTKAISELAINLEQTSYLSPIRLKMSLTKYSNVNSYFSKAINNPNGFLMQQDAQEFLSHLLELLEIENKKFIDDNFYGQVQTFIKSPGGSKRSSIDKDGDPQTSGDGQDQNDLNTGIKKLPAENFNFLQLPLPSDNYIRIDPILILNDGSIPIRFEIEVQRNDFLGDIYKKIEDFYSLKTNTPPICFQKDKFQITEVVGGRIKKLHKSSDKFNNEMINLGALHIYQLPENCESFNDCCIIYHRKFIKQDNNFHDKIKFCPVIFSFPILVDAKLEYSEFLESVKRQAGRILTKLPKGIDATKNLEQVGLAEEDYTLKNIDISGYWSNSEDWLKFSRGGDVNETNFKNSKYLSIDWNLKNYLAKYIPGGDQFSTFQTVPKESVKIEKLLENYFSPDIILNHETNESNTHQLNLVKAPKILLLQLQRAGVEKKNNSKIEFEKFLKLKSSIASKTTNYELKGFIVHYGKDMNSGHFISVCKTSNSQWFVFNDSNSQKLSSFLATIGEKMAGIRNNLSNRSNSNGQNWSKITDENKMFKEFTSNVYILAYEKVTNKEDKEDYNNDTNSENSDNENTDNHEMKIKQAEVEEKLGRELDKLEMGTCVLM